MAGRIAAEFVIPRYQALSAAAKHQARAWELFCAAPAASGLESVRAAYFASADEWSRAEIIRYGPVSADFRAERISYWPERKNATAKGLAQLLAGTGELSPEAMRGASAAAQGLPALERLLFPEKPAEASEFAGSPAAERRCAVGRAIAANVSAIAAEVLRRWAMEDGVARTLLSAQPANEAVRRLGTDLLTAFQSIRDQKLLPVLGKEAATAKPRLAEGWRSGRTKQALLLNLQSIEELTQIILDRAPDDERSAALTIRAARRIAENLPADFPRLAADPAQRYKVVLLFDALGFARDGALIDVPRALGITLGFNSLDGD
jgi:predicted lipoprotein